MTADLICYKICANCSYNGPYFCTVKSNLSDLMRDLNMQILDPCLISKVVAAHLLHHGWQFFVIDINECSPIPGRSNNCTQICINTDGSYYCSCNSGYFDPYHNGTCIGMTSRTYRAHFWKYILPLAAKSALCALIFQNLHCSVQFGRKCVTHSSAPR